MCLAGLQSLEVPQIQTQEAECLKTRNILCRNYYPSISLEQLVYRQMPISH